MVLLKFYPPRVSPPPTAALPSRDDARGDACHFVSLPNKVLREPRYISSSFLSLPAAYTRAASRGEDGERVDEDSRPSLFVWPRKPHPSHTREAIHTYGGFSKHPRQPEHARGRK